MDKTISAEKITVSREEALGGSAREAAANISVAALWMNAMEAAENIPSTPEVVTRQDSNTKTLEWQNGNAHWQRKRW